MMLMMSPSQAALQKVTRFISFNNRKGKERNMSTVQWTREVELEKMTPNKARLIVGESDWLSADIMLPVTDMSSLTPNETQLPCELPYDEGRLPLVLLYSGVLTVGFPANLVTVWLSWLQVRRKNVLGVYLWFLSLCDLSYLLTLPLWADYVRRGHSWHLTSVACKLTGFVFFTNMYVSIFLLCCISCDRYVAIVFSLEARGRRRRHHAALIALAVVLLVAVGHVPVFTMREGATDTEGPRRCFEPNQNSPTVTAFNYARFLVGFLFPLLLLAATNHGILTNVQRSTGLQRQQKRRVCWLAVAVVLLFLVCFAPYHLILLLRAVLVSFPIQSCLLERTLYMPYTISLGLSTINSAVNPVLYVLSSDCVRRDLSRGLVQICGRALPRPRSSSSKIHPNNHQLELITGTTENQIHLTNNHLELVAGTTGNHRKPQRT